MLIKSIGTNLYKNVTNQMYYANNNSKECANTYSNSTSDLLSFDNYGRSLLNKPSFKKLMAMSDIERINALNSIEETDLSKKISSLISMVEKPNVVLVGNDEKKDLELLTNHIDSYHMDFLIKKIYYINDKEAKIPFLLVKKPDSNAIYTTVLDEKKADYLSKKESTEFDDLHLSFDDVFALSRDAFTILLKSKVENENMMNPKHKVFDVNKDNKITDLNKTAIENFIAGDDKKVNAQDKLDSKKVRSNITFNEIGGLDDVLDRIKKEILYPIKMPFAYEKRKKIDHGTILYGIPGTGKSLIGEALANEAGANFIKINASELESMYVGQTEKHWRKLFDKAVQSQPCIIFIDEFDAIAKERGGMDVYGDKALNTILSLMSNLEKNNDSVYVIAATNKFEYLDSAVTRKGRFGNHIQVPKPNLQGCYTIFKIHSKNMKIEEEFLEDTFAKKLHERRATGSDIAAVIDKAWDEAYERLGLFKKMENNTLTQKDIDSVIVTHDDFYQALDIVLSKNTQEN